MDEGEYSIQQQEPKPVQITATCMGTDNRRYYKIQWSESWAPEELLVDKYSGLIATYWKDYLQEGKDQETQNESAAVQEDPTEQNIAAYTLNNPFDREVESRLSASQEASDTNSGVKNLIQASQKLPTGDKWYNQPLRRQCVIPPDSKLDSRQLTNPELRPFKCIDCSRSYSTQQRLKDHRRKIHANRGEFPCTLCTKMFPNKRNLQLHMDRHTGIGPHSCRGCMKKFMIKTDCEHHQRSCDRLVRKDYVCNVCGKAFSTRTHLTFHQKIHIPDEQKPFQCTHCPRRFSYNHDCVHHMRLHVGEKPFKCKECPKAFHRKTYLMEHMFEHTGVSKHRCQECQQYFKTQQMLQTHVKNIHVLKKPPPGSTDTVKKKKKKKKVKYKCVKCDKEFRFMKEYHYHTAVNHKDDIDVEIKKEVEFSCFEPTMVYKCKYCDKSFQWPSMLKKHAQVHNWDAMLDQYIEIVEEDKSKIPKVPTGDAVGDAISDADHVMVQVEFPGGEPVEMAVPKASISSWKCNVCQAVFANESDLREHLSQQHPQYCTEEDSPSSNTPISNRPIEKKKSSVKQTARCELCKKVFSTIKSARAHFRKVHSDVKKKINKKAKTVQSNSSDLKSTSSDVNNSSHMVETENPAPVDELLDNNDMNGSVSALPSDSVNRQEVNFDAYRITSPKGSPEKLNLPIETLQQKLSSSSTQDVAMTSSSSNQQADSKEKSVHESILNLQALPTQNEQGVVTNSDQPLSEQQELVTNSHPSFNEQLEALLMQCGENAKIRIINDGAGSGQHLVFLAADSEEADDADITTSES